MEDSKPVPEGLELRPADPVDAMCVGDLCTGKNGNRYRLVGTQYPCERHLLFKGVGPGYELIELPLSQASEFMTPDENRAEGLHVVVELPRK